MAKKKAAKKAAKSAAASKPRPAAKKAAKTKAAAKSKPAAKAKPAVKAKAAVKAKPAAKTKTAAKAKTAPKPKPAAKKAVRRPAPAPAPSNDERRQAEAYARAVEAFQGGKLKQALKLFQAVAEGPDTGLRHRANVHIQICRRRTESDTVVLATAEDHYNYAVKLINDRRLEEADQHLDKALKKASRAGYVHYAKAVVAALRRKAEEAHRSLSRAVELDPRHRLLARRDPDMAGVRDDARIAELIHGDASSGDS